MKRALVLVLTVSAFAQTAKKPTLGPSITLTKGEELLLISKRIDLREASKRYQDDGMAFQKAAQTLPEYQRLHADQTALDVAVNELRAAAAAAIRKHGLEGKLWYDLQSGSFVNKAPQESAE